jgi:plastocyanin
LPVRTLSAHGPAVHVLGLVARVLLAGALVGGVVALVANGVALADQTASITDAGYDPAVVTVHAGESIVWTNTGSVAHAVTADDGTFDSGPIAPGQQWGVTLTEVGSFLIHSDTGGFHGRVDVQGIDVTHAPTPTPMPSASGPAGIPPGAGGDPDPTAILVIVAGLGLLVGIAYGYSRRNRLPQRRSR